jgi:hypothetical protein
MSETRKLAAILVSDVVGYSRLAGADEDRTLARLGAPQRPHRPGHRRSSRPYREAHGGGHPSLRSNIPLRTSIAQRTESTTPRSSMMLPLATRTSTSAPCRVRLRQAPAIRKPK